MKIGWLKIARDELSVDILNFCAKFNLFSEPELAGVTADSLSKQLEYKDFINQLALLLTQRACTAENVDLIRLKALLTELEQVKKDLESEGQ